MNRRETLTAITIAVVITAVLLFAAKAQASQGFSFSDPAFIRMLQRGSAAAPAGPTNSPLITNLVAYYRLDSQSWTSAIIGSPLTLTEENGPITNSPGLITNGVGFNASAQQLLTSDDDAFLITNRQPFSVAFAARWSTLPDSTLTAQREIDGVDAVWGFDKSGTTFRFYMVKSGGGFDILSSSTSAQLRLSNVWHTFIITCDGTNTTMRVDLTNLVSMALTGSYGVGDPPLVIGAQRSGAGHFGGWLDCYGFWRTNLSAALQTNWHVQVTNLLGTIREYPWSSNYP